MKLYRVVDICTTLIVAVSAAVSVRDARSQTIVALPQPQAAIDMARGVTFDEAAVTDKPLSASVAKLNPKFAIKVYFRPNIATMEYKRDVGAVFAKVALSGIPAERLLPDGEYYLWMGGNGDLLRAALVKVDGSVVKEVEVLPQPTLMEEMVPHAPKVHAVVETVDAQFPLPRPPPPLPHPPGPPPAPPPPRSWREICVPSNPNQDHGKPNPKKWVRVPDN